MRSENEHGQPQELVPLVKWIWRSYLKTSLLPLLFVEIALIFIYFVSNAFSTAENIQAVRSLAENQLAQLSLVESKSINHQLKSISEATDFLRNETNRVMTTPPGKAGGNTDEPTGFAYAPSGVYYSTHDEGGSALFYSAIVPVGAPERMKAGRSKGLDPAFKGVKESFPLIVQVYYNTHDSLNRIYPYFDVLSQYEPKMDIPSFNFYYEADAAHNPSRKVVWTDVYVDPAGQGWMTSCIAPVYAGDFLEGVVGSDVTVGTIVNDVLNLNIPWGGYGMLVSRDGAIIALPKAGEDDWGVKQSAQHNYLTTIKQDTFQPETFNLYKHLGNTGLSTHIRKNADGINHSMFAQKSIISWATIPETGWKLLVVVPEENIYQPVQALSDRLNSIAWLMIFGMLMFYSIFFTLLYRRAKRMSHFVSEPLMRIDAMVSSIARGQYHQQVPELAVSELHHTAEGIVQMGGQIDLAWKQHSRAKDELRKQKKQLQSIFDLSPDAFVSIDASSHIALVNPAFLDITGTNAQQWVGRSQTEFWQMFFLQCSTPEPQLPMQEGGMRIELKRPRKCILACEIRDIRAMNENAEDAGYGGSVICMRNITKDEELNLMKSEFVSLAAHELRTPVTIIFGYAELLLNDEIPPEMIRESVQLIHEKTARLTTIINDLLDLSRIDARSGKDFHFQNLDASELVSEAVSGFSNPPERLPVTLGKLISARVSVDPSRFRQALVNAINNAYKFSSSGEIRVGMVERSDDKGSTVGITVTDHGIGVSQENLPRVFDRFWQEDKSGKLPGTGLGMSITREMITIMHGQVEMESSPGHGSKVTIWMPEIED